MRHFPIFLDLTGRRIVVSGAGECAVSKLRLLLKTDANIAVFGLSPVPQVQSWAAEGRIDLVERAIEDGDAEGASLLYAANEDEQEDARAAAIGRKAGALVNIVDDLARGDHRYLVLRMGAIVALVIGAFVGALAILVAPALGPVVPAVTGCAAFAISVGAVRRLRHTQ